MPDLQYDSLVADHAYRLTEMRHAVYLIGFDENEEVPHDLRVGRDSDREDADFNDVLVDQIAEGERRPLIGKGVEKEKDEVEVFLEVRVRKLTILLDVFLN